MSFERVCTATKCTLCAHNLYNHNACHQMRVVPKRGILEIRTPFWSRFRLAAMQGESMRKEKYLEQKHKVMYDGGANDPS